MNAQRDRSVDEEAVETVVHKTWEALARFDRDGLKEHFALDCLLTIDKTKIDGHDELAVFLRWLRNMYGTISITDRGTRVTVDGDSARAISTVWLLLTTKNYRNYSCEATMACQLQRIEERWVIQSLTFQYLAGRTWVKHGIGNFVSLVRHAKELQPVSLPKAA